MASDATTPVRKLTLDERWIRQLGDHTTKVNAGVDEDAAKRNAITILTGYIHRYLPKAPHLNNDVSQAADALIRAIGAPAVTLICRAQKNAYLLQHISNALVPPESEAINLRHNDLNAENYREILVACRRWEGSAARRPTDVDNAISTSISRLRSYAEVQLKASYRAAPSTDDRRPLLAELREISDALSPAFAEESRQAYLEVLKTDIEAVVTRDTSLTAKLARFESAYRVLDAIALPAEKMVAYAKFNSAISTINTGTQEPQDHAEFLIGLCHSEILPADVTKESVPKLYELLDAIRADNPKLGLTLEGNFVSGTIDKQTQAARIKKFNEHAGTIDLNTVFEVSWGCLLMPDEPRGWQRNAMETAVQRAKANAAAQHEKAFENLLEQAPFDAAVLIANAALELFDDKGSPAARELLVRERDLLIRTKGNGLRVITASRSNDPSGGTMPS